MIFAIWRTRYQVQLGRDTRNQEGCTNIDELLVEAKFVQITHFFFFKRSGPHRDLPSFPTRPSSDLRRALRAIPEPECPLPAGGAAIARSLSARRRATLEAIADTFAPGAAERGVADAFLEKFVSRLDRKSTRLNYSHSQNTDAVLCFE